MNRQPSTAFFQMIVDDGGFERTWPEPRGEKIPFAAYRNIVRLAKHFEIQIVLACTTRFLDVHRVSGSPGPHSDSGRLIDLLGRHRNRIIVADHGFDHIFGSGYAEFYDYRTGTAPDESAQRRRIEESRKIYDSLKWPFPPVFVPPAHGWQPGVTDRLYAEAGAKFLSGVLWIKSGIADLTGATRANLFHPMRPAVSYPGRSPYLKILPRLGLGIPSAMMKVSRLFWWKAFHSVFPASPIYGYIWHRRRVGQPHNYMAHVANFASEENYRRWKRFLQKIRSEKCRLARSFSESVALWEAAAKRERAPR